MNDAVRPLYEKFGARGFYERFGEHYRNPHEPVIERLVELAVASWPLDLADVLDLACGSGEVTLVLERLGAGRVSGIDPFTGDAYQKRTGRAAEPMTFDAIAGGSLAGRSYSLIVCSFALHLVDAPRIPQLAFELSRVSSSLLVLTPHKRPAIKPAWGWTLHGELLRERVRARYYRTNLKL